MRVKNVSLLIATIIYGIIYGILGKVLYDNLIDVWPKPLVIGVYFLLFATLLFLVVYFFSRKKQSLFSDYLLRDAIISVLCVGILATGLEFVYELGKKPVYKEPTSYIFLIDDSGSMQGNDPNGERVRAIGTLLNEQKLDFNYAVYLFSNGYEMFRPMLPRKDGFGTVTLKSEGGTAISATIKGVTNDIVTGKLQGGASPRVLLMSDGVSTDSIFGTFGIRKQLRTLREHGVTVSTVGLGDSVDTSFMRSIAKSTGGVYINVDNVSELSSAMKSALLSYGERDLLSVRPVVSADWLYCLLRVLFIALISSAVLIVKCLACGGNRFGIVITVCSVLNLIAALFVEIGLNGFTLDERLVHAICCVLIAVIMNEYLVFSPITTPDVGTKPDVKIGGSDEIVPKGKTHQNHTDTLG